MHPELWARWGDIVGPQLCRRCVPLSLQRGRLVVGVSNSTWLHELSFLIPALLDRFAEEVGPGIVKEIRLVAHPQLFVKKPKPPQNPLPAFDGPLPALVAQILDGIADEELKRNAERAYRANLKKYESDRS